MSIWERFMRHRKGHRKGWPRDVRPMFPELEIVKTEHPNVWQEVRHMPAGCGLHILRQRGLI